MMIVVGLDRPRLCSVGRLFNVPTTGIQEGPVVSKLTTTRRRTMERGEWERNADGRNRDVREVVVDEIQRSRVDRMLLWEKVKREEKGGEERKRRTKVRTEKQKSNLGEGDDDDDDDVIKGESRRQSTTSTQFHSIPSPKLLGRSPPSQTGDGPRPSMPRRRFISRDPTSSSSYVARQRGISERRWYEYIEEVFARYRSRTPRRVGTKRYDVRESIQHLRHHFVLHRGHMGYQSNN